MGKLASRAAATVALAAISFVVLSGGCMGTDDGDGGNCQLSCSDSPYYAADDCGSGCMLGDVEAICTGASCQVVAGQTLVIIFQHELSRSNFPDVLVELDASVSGVELQIDGIVVPLTSSNQVLHGATPATIHVGSEIRLRYDKGPDTAARIQLEDQSCVEARNACDGGGA